MKVTIKTLQADSYQIDAEPTDSIRVIKSKIEESRGISAHLQRIIFSGELLKDDDRTLESYGFSEDKFLILMVNQKNQKNKTPIQGMPPTPYLGHVDRPINNNAPGPSLVTAPVNTSTVSPATAGPSNYPGALVLNSRQSSIPSSAVPHRPQATRKAQIVGVDPDGNNKLLATLEGSEVNDFEELKAMGFPQQATVEAYLLCDKNKEHAAIYLLENSSDAHFSDPESTKNGAPTIPWSQPTRMTRICGVDSEGNEEIITTLEGSQIDEFEQLEALGFPRNVTLAAYLACGKNTGIAASILAEHGNDFNSSSMPVSGPSTISKSLMTLPSKTPITGDTQTVPAPALPETPIPSVLSPTITSLVKQPKRPLSPESDLSSLDANASKRFKTSEDSSADLSCMLPSLSTSLLTEASSVSSVDIPSEVTIIDDSEIEQNFSSEEKAIMNRLENMGFPREAVIEAICVCDGDEERSVEYLYDNGYEL
ncbi:ubiquitin-domain-containing protein [Dendrothele bispora CBS 962.96]|uniref:UV excision repair protein RAD23 n=1 Tax=Dendrothele bispora (strain CBS 962.96) TaxID=1314807 RepID=A0A4S8LGK9_DENBC|nr:ubiquitin-domain-containing protein [Dendrothele bispora CBS 962.96]